MYPPTEEPPARPTTGIVARVDITLPTPPEPPVPLPSQLADVAAAAIPLIQIQTDNNRNGVPQSQRTDAPNLNRTASKAGPSLVQKLNDHIPDFIEFSQQQQLARELGMVADDETSYNEQMPALTIFQDPIDEAKAAAVAKSAALALSAVNGNDAGEPSTASGGGLPKLSSLLQQDATSSRSAVDSYAPAFTSLMDQRADDEGDSGAAQPVKVDDAYPTTVGDLLPALSQLQMVASQDASFNMPDLSGLGNSTSG